MRWTAGSTALLALATACSRPAPTTGAVVALPPAADLLGEMATAALIADARLEAADSLYTQDAEIIAEGRRRMEPPRFAGIEAGGQVIVGSTRVDLSGNFGWALVEYRWLAADQNLLREGRATLVFVRAAGTGAWRITHAHSSLVH
ncbi:MAG TPA: nuclear transport factor 2 family protein [Gemmatimonadales bacterium]|jgi:hypothetical protein|nr:nuclear transport factor 2 family protein [Gemmatimonadales bacterium]